MINPALLQKERQDDTRRRQQTDERIRELEKERKRLRTAIALALFDFDHGRTQDAADTLRKAFAGGGDA